MIRTLRLTPSQLGHRAELLFYSYFTILLLSRGNPGRTASRRLFIGLDNVAAIYGTIQIAWVDLMTDVLFGLQKEFPGYRIWQECHGERKRYIACRLHVGIRPHSVVTADPDELRDVLSGRWDSEDGS
jgi:hypothetical protein